MYSKSFYIAVDPVGSKFAKAIQSAVKEKVTNKVFRVDHRRAVTRQRLGRRVFFVTPTTLNKIQQFQRFKENNVSCPNFTTNPNAVDQLGSKTVFARTLVNSTNGRGIVEFEVGKDATPRAPLYTEYIPKKAEYRVHVFGNTVIDIQQKRKKRGFEQERDTRVRNMANGYVYCRDGISPPDGIGELAVKAVRAVGYQYGAVDIVFNEKNNRLAVLEVNSRPGLLGTTLNNYRDALVSQFDLRLK